PVVHHLEGRDAVVEGRTRQLVDDGVVAVDERGGDLEQLRSRARVQADQPRALVLALDELADLLAEELVPDVVELGHQFTLAPCPSSAASRIASRFSIGVCSGIAPSGPIICPPASRFFRTSERTSSGPRAKSVSGLLTFPTSAIRPSTASIDSPGWF